MTKPLALERGPRGTTDSLAAAHEEKTRDTTIHECPGSKRAKVRLEYHRYLNDLGDAATGRTVNGWEMLSGRHPEFGIQFCPYCGKDLCEPAEGEIPTSMTLREAEALMKVARGRDVLEIGSLLGFSTIVLAKVAKSVWAIDPHHGYPVAAPKPTLSGFLRNLESFGVRDKVVPILARGQDVLHALKGRFGLVFIDITTSAKDLIFEANSLEPRYIAVHDYKHPEWTGATEAVEEFFSMRSYPMEVVDRLAIIDVQSGRDGYYE